MDSVHKFFKYAAVCLCSIFVAAALITGVYAEEDLPSRAIYVVYDDSGSMYVDDATGDLVDTWSKAKYSMEVFAAMLNKDDTMNIYYMSDYTEGGDKDGPRIELSGKDDTQSNIQKIRDEMTSSGRTPFEAVEAACEDLEDADADEKWLVVLTDGDFQFDGNIISDKSKVVEAMDDYFEDKDDDIHVAFLAIGQDTVPITEDKEDNLFFEKAEDSSQILSKVNEISNRIFNENKLSVNSEDGTFVLDIPMSELTVFAQGETVKIKKLTDEDGDKIKETSPAVVVSATEASDNTKHPENEPDSELYGEIAVFEGTFLPGTYKISTSNAKTVEVYFKPVLEVAAYLTNESGARIDDLSDLATGDYVVHFELVSGVDHSTLPEDNIISQSEYGIQYEAIVTNNGQTLDQVYQDGDTIHVDQGDLEIDVTATYLKYNTSSTKLNHQVYSEKNVTFDVDDSVNWTLTDHLVPDEPVQVKMLVESKTPTEEEWEEINVPSASLLLGNSEKAGALSVEKSSEPGVFLLSATDETFDADHIPYEQASVELTFDQEVGSIPWTGSSKEEVPVNDSRSWWVKNGEWLKSHWWLFLLLGLLLIALIGYIPGIKKYLPKYNPKPNIKCTANPGSPSRKDEKGRVEKNWTRFVPFMPVTAQIRFAPSGGGENFPKLSVKAAGGGKVTVLNQKQLSKYQNITYNNGTHFSADDNKQKPMSLNSVKTAGKKYTYTCSLKGK